MSLEDQYDAWVRGLMGGRKYTDNARQTAAAQNAMQEMQAQLDALTAAQKRHRAADAAVETVAACRAGNRRPGTPHEQ